jgi:hypothetical protein
LGAAAAGQGNQQKKTLWTPEYRFSGAKASHHVENAAFSDGQP